MFLKMQVLYNLAGGIGIIVNSYCIETSNIILYLNFMCYNEDCYCV